MLLTILFWTIVYYFVGVMVLAFVDEDNELYNWLNRAPHGFGEIAILFWPVIVFLFYKEYKIPKRKEERGNNDNKGN